MLIRDLEKTILKHVKKGFVALIYGARRTGKTVLLNKLREHWRNESALLFNGDTEEDRFALSTTSEIKLTNLVKGKSLILIDEAQRIQHIGLALKILIDKFPEKKIIATGSSSLHLSHGLKENLTGRNLTFKLFSLSTKELAGTLDKHKISSFLEDQLVYGAYPYLCSLNTPQEKEAYLYSITEDYLFKDIFELEKINNKDTVRKLASLLAFQIGKEVSLNELARNLNIDIKTVARYLNLLEESFVIFQMGAYSTNLRNEIAKIKKYYFYDLGIRNALTKQFAPLNSRVDQGELWENFLIMEKIKQTEYDRKNKTFYFWRDYNGAEVDLIEQSGDGKLNAFEFKWKKNNFKTPQRFKMSYETNVLLINRDNYLDFLGL